MPAASVRKTSSATERDPRWAQVCARDPSADGAFVYSVATTGVYCRPSCASRQARPENVRFHATTAAARAAGFRACKRCKPDEAGLRAAYAAKVAAACRTIETAETAPTLAVLAQAAGLSPFHFHRVFKTVAGVTPKAYAAAHRTKRVRTELARGGSVTAAIYDAGFNSSGRFYEQAGKVLGMKPRDFKAGGASATIQFAVGQCSLGAVLVAATDKGICAITLDDDPETLLRDLQDRFPRATLVGGDKAFERTVAAVVGFVDKPEIGLGLPLDAQGTAFQHRVWKALRNIPAGKTVSYTEVARAIGAPKSVRAVARACATNAVAVAIPCHRVVRTDGDLAGYRWGIARKRALLKKEKVA